MAISRMQFLRGDISGKKSPLRPPWALNEDAFITQCDRCGQCIDVCPTHIIQAGRGGFPEIDFSRDECLFCGDCAAACKPQALHKVEGHSPWNLKATLDTRACIAFMGVECRGCVDPCEPRAVRISFRPRGVGTPDIDSQACTGCGACVRVCPAQAISMQPLPA